MRFCITTENKGNRMRMDVREKTGEGGEANMCRPRVNGMGVANVRRPSVNGKGVANMRRPRVDGKGVANVRRPRIWGKRRPRCSSFFCFQSSYFGVGFVSEK